MNINQGRETIRLCRFAANKFQYLVKLGANLFEGCANRPPVAVTVINLDEKNSFFKSKFARYVLAIYLQWW
jgi:hypothetical protein